MRTFLPWDVMGCVRRHAVFGCDIVFLVLCWMLRHIYIWLFQAFHTQTPWTLCTINMLHIICTTVYSIVKPTSSLLFASSIGTVPSTRRGGVLVECWYLRISIDFPLRFSISVSLIWSSCSPLSIQWCFYLHWHPYFLHLSTQSTHLLSSTLCFSSALVLLTFSTWRWRFLSFCFVVKNFVLTLDLVLPWSLRTLSHFSSWQQRHASFVSSVLLCSYTML